MGLNHSPKIVTNGLVFCTDAGNTGKSWKGKPTTNSVTNADVMSGWTNYYRTTASSTFLTEFGTIGYRFINQPSWNGIYKSITIPATGTYTFSARFRYFGGSSNNNGATVYISGWGGGDSAVAIDKSKVGVWQNISMTLNCTNTSFTFYIISYGGTDNGTGNPDFSSWEVTMPQAEAGTFATPFVAGTRSNTQAILDLTKQNTIIANNLTYASNGSFSFNGSPDPIKTSSNYGYPNNMTWGAWVKRSSSLNTYNMFMGAYLPYFSFRSGNFVTFSNSTGGSQRTISSTGVTLADNTWYHFMFTSEYDGTTNTTMKIYINGVLNNTEAFAGSQTNSGYPITIGSWYPAATDYPFSGIVDSVNVYNRALTAAEVQQNFNALRGRYGI